MTTDDDRPPQAAQAPHPDEPSPGSALDPATAREISDDDDTPG